MGQVVTDLLVSTVSVATFRNDVGVFPRVTRIGITIVTREFLTNCLPVVASMGIRRYVDINSGHSRLWLTGLPLTDLLHARVLSAAALARRSRSWDGSVSLRNSWPSPYFFPIPFGTVFGFYLAELERQVQITQRERIGVEALRHLMPVMEHLTLRRELGWKVRAVSEDQRSAAVASLNLTMQQAVRDWQDTSPAVQTLVQQ